MHSIAFGTDNRGFDPRQRQELLPYSTAYRSATVHCIPYAHSPDTKHPRRKDDHSTPSSAEVKNVWSYTYSPPYVLVVWCLI